eukprot:163191-Alexandrium_andersonii.AAC.1
MASLLRELAVLTATSSWRMCCPFFISARVALFCGHVVCGGVGGWRGHARVKGQTPSSRTLG